MTDILPHHIVKYLLYDYLSVSIPLHSGHISLHISVVSNQPIIITISNHITTSMTNAHNSHALMIKLLTAEIVQHSYLQLSLIHYYMFTEPMTRLIHM